jgi:hypothetical protein
MWGVVGGSLKGGNLAGPFMGRIVRRVRFVLGPVRRF